MADLKPFRVPLLSTRDLVVVRRRAGQACRSCSVGRMAAVSWVGCISDVARAVIEHGDGELTIGFGDGVLYGEFAYEGEVPFRGPIPSGVQTEQRENGVAVLVRGAQSPVTLPPSAGQSFFGELQVQHRELEHHQRKLAELHAQLREREAALTRSNNDLEAFAVGASHDLKEPLQVISMYGDVALAQLDEEHPAREQVTVMVDAAKRMSVMLRGLMVYARIDERQPAVQGVDLRGAAEGALANLEARLIECEADVQMEGPEVVLQVAPVHLHQIVQNLVANAIKYRHEDRPLRIGVFWIQETDRVILGIEDNGPGIPEADRPRMFGLFKRLPRDSAKEGAGVGLALVRRLAERYDGSVRVEESRWGGARFELDLPAQPAP